MTAAVSPFSPPTGQATAGVASPVDQAAAAPSTLAPAPSPSPAAPTATPPRPSPGCRDAIRKQTERIEELRRLLRPSPVRLHEVPAWLRRRLLAAFRGERAGKRLLTDGFSVLMHAAQMTGGDRWLDHWGRADHHGHDALVTEPYSLSAQTLDQIERFAQRCNLAYDVSPNSWWNPGQTWRVALWDRVAADNKEDTP